MNSQYTDCAQIMVLLLRRALVHVDTVVRRFAARLHNLRLEKGLSQQALASRSGLHPHYISGLERCAHSPTLSSLEKIARGLRVDIAVLVDFPENKNKRDDRAREEVELINRRLKSCTLDQLRRLRKSIDALIG